MIPPFQLKKTIGRSYNVDLDDVRNVKSALQGLGYYRTPGYGMTPYPDEPMFQGIEKLQERHGLVKDGVMKPGGPTERLMAQNLNPENRNDPDPIWGDKEPRYNLTRSLRNMRQWTKDGAALGLLGSSRIPGLPPHVGAAAGAGAGALSGFMSGFGNRHRPEDWGRDPNFGP